MYLINLRIHSVFPVKYLQVQHTLQTPQSELHYFSSEALRAE